MSADSGSSVSSNSSEDDDATDENAEPTQGTSVEGQPTNLKHTLKVLLRLYICYYSATAFNSLIYVVNSYSPCAI